MGPTWGSPGSCRLQMGPMLAPVTLLSGLRDSTISTQVTNTTERWRRCPHWLSPFITRPLTRHEYGMSRVLESGRQIWRKYFSLDWIHHLDGLAPLLTSASRAHRMIYWPLEWWCFFWKYQNIQNDYKSSYRIGWIDNVVRPALITWLIWYYVVEVIIPHGILCGVIFDPSSGGSDQLRHNERGLKSPASRLFDQLSG